MKTKFVLFLLGTALSAQTALGQQGDSPTGLPSASAACRAFDDFATQRKTDPRYISSTHGELDPLQTDGLLVMKNGKVVYEWYDGVVTEKTPHLLWSASKDITATLVARTLQDGYSYNGKKVTLDTQVAEFFPQPGVLVQHPEMREAYNRMTIRHLIEMSANFEWKEYYDEDLAHSNFLPMLYLDGNKDMAGFALSTPLSPEGPGGRWNYSGGNANILMAILQKIHGANYDQMPWKILFDKLGMKDVRIGRDGSGRFIGSSYVYMTLRDMGKIGQLYLQNGKWDGQQLLPSDWTKDVQQVADGYYKKSTSLDVIKKLGTESRRVFWLNKPVYRDDGAFADSSGRRILYPPEMPEAPSDMFFAAGHYGQLIIVIPSENVVIVRTGHDLKYWDHIQPIVVKALSCLDPSYRPNPVADLTPPSAGAKTNVIEDLVSTVGGLPRNIGMIDYLKTSGLGSAMMAQEMCGFLYVMRANETLAPEKFKDEYIARSGLPSIATGLLLSNMHIDIDNANSSVTTSRMRYVTEHGRVTARVELNKFRATLDPRYRAACKLERLQ
jgi:CubicO group peptidase (beta-lactamase class C family)